jgi:Rv2525c-like, glycoside hydrolase-like domain
LGVIVVDYAWARPTVAQLKSWNAVAVCQYVGQDTTGKNMTAADVSCHAAAGIKTITCFEFSAAQAKNGYSQGVTDAQLGLSQAAACGMPNWAPIFFAVDVDLQDYAPGSSDPMAKLGPVGQYFRGACSVLGLDRVGVYGSYYVVERTINACVATYGWQTVAWSGGQIDTAQIQLYQTGQRLAGGQVDVNVIVNDISSIAWMPGGASPDVVGKEWITVGSLSLNDFADQIANCGVSTLLRQTAVKYQIFDDNLADYLNGLADGSIPWTQAMPAGCKFWIKN